MRWRLANERAAQTARCIDCAIITTGIRELHVLLQREINPELNTVTAYGDDYLVINQDRFETAVCFAPQGPVRGLDLRRPEEISSGFLEDLLGIQSASQDPMAFLEGATGPSLPADAPEVLLIG